MFIDTHVHFDRFVRDGSFPAVLQRAKEAKVFEMMAIGGSPAANELALRLAGEHPGRIFAAAGYDRDEAEAPPDFEPLRELLADPFVKAVGEIGLDYYYGKEHAAAQRRLLEEQLALAVEYEKPVVVHTRDADDDTLALLRAFASAWSGDPGRKGVIHCFTRDYAFARAVLDLGFMISFSGIVTFANAEALRETAKRIPGDRLLIETDAPYLAPVPFRGRLNEPALVVHTAERLAEVRGVLLESLAEQTARNARFLFGL